MAVFLRNTPIKRKLMVVILLTSGFAMLLMGSALFTYEMITFRSSLEANIRMFAEMIGSNSTAALAFQDKRGAQEILSAVSVEHQITAAAIYDSKGQIFVRFPTNMPLDLFPKTPRPDGHRFERSRLEMFRPIVQEGTRLGTIYLQADLGEMYSRFRIYSVLLLLVTLCASLGAIGLTTVLQKRISQPILELAKVATAVSERQDYSVRGLKLGTDEIGQLTEAFNQMLTRIGDSSTALMASEERLRLALEGSQTGTWDWNLVTGKITWDDYMYPLFGRKKEDFQGRSVSFMEFVHPDDRSVLEQAVGRALQGGENFDVDFRIIDPDGTVRHMALRGRAFYDSKGKAIRMSGVSMDVTQKKRYEEELSRAKELAEAANKAKDNFLAILSHELRTPLTPVLTVIATLEEDYVVGPQIVGELQTIRRNIELEARLIDDLLDVTGIIRGKLELNRQVVDVRSLLEHTVQNYCLRDAARKNLRVTTNVSAAETNVLADSSRMTQVFWNVLQNACKFTPQGGAVDIRLYNRVPEQSGNGAPNGPESSHEELVVEISDTGIGISPENMPRIFNAFEQGERSRTRVFGGLGLGLAISRAIVEMHGGTIEAESSGKDRGAKFTIRLPTVQAEAAAGHPRMHPASQPAGPERSRALRILLVEDHRDTAEQLIRLLKRAGHEVAWAGTIREARELLATNSRLSRDAAFNLLISDLGLPDGTGHDLMRDLARSHRMPGIALSGYGMREDIRDSVEAGFSRHMTKPVDWQELKVAIQTIAVSQIS